MGNSLSLQLKNDLSELDTMRDPLDNFYASHNLPDNVRHAFDMALEEIFVNIVSYAFEDNKEHIIDLSLQVKGNEVVGDLKDDGEPYNPLLRPDPKIDLGIDERKIGGLGIYLTKRLMDEVEYKYENNINCLMFKKYLSPNG